MAEKKDILSLNDIKLLVNTFYDEAQKDMLLGPVFNARIKDWDKHLNIMYTFWQTVILDAYTYKGAPFNKHVDLPLEKVHFDHWVKLFSGVIDSLFEGPNANNAKQRASQFGMVFWSKMEYMHKG
jgi:hemoglobin